MDDEMMQPMMTPGQGIPPVNFANGSMPQSGNMQGQMGSQMTPQMQPMMGVNGQPMAGANGMPVMQAAPIVQVQKESKSGASKTIVTIVFALVAVAFIGLFVWKQIELMSIQGDLDGQIDAAVEKAKYEQQAEDMAKLADEEKSPWLEFVGPEDYGSLGFMYPRTWSIYVAKNAAYGGDYEAYFNPIAVEALSPSTIYALRLDILNQSFEKVVADYQKLVQDSKGTFAMESVTINGINMNRYSGKIPKTEFYGIIVLFKIRDKTVVMRTDNAEGFGGDFETLLNTIQFNE